MGWVGQGEGLGGGGGLGVEGKWGSCCNLNQLLHSCPGTDAVDG